MGKNLSLSSGAICREEEPGIIKSIAGNVLEIHDIATAAVQKPLFTLAAVAISLMVLLTSRKREQ